jgi:hypothetical protein
MRRVLPLLLVSFMIVPNPAAAWWETGHETVARLAVTRLTPAALTRTAQILGVADDRQTVSDALAEASLWPDQTKGKTHTADWHYINLTFADGRSGFAKRCEDDDCITARIRLFSAQLAAKTNARDSNSSDLDALRYLVHFVADIHQPLHAVSDADQGGNCELLNPPVGKAKNLHSLWDGELVNAINPDDRALTTELEKDLARMKSGRQEALSAGDAEDWAWESHQLARNLIYRKLRIPKQPEVFPEKCSEAPAGISKMSLRIQASYIRSMKPVVERQLEKAGLRLARVLNESL